MLFYSLITEDFIQRNFFGLYIWILERESVFLEGILVCDNLFDLFLFLPFLSAFKLTMYQF